MMQAREPPLMASSFDGLGPHVPLSTQIMVETLPRLGDVSNLPDQPGISYDNEKRATGSRPGKSSARHETSGFSCRPRRAGADRSAGVPPRRFRSVSHPLDDQAIRP